MKEEIKDALAFVYDEIGNTVEEMNKSGTPYDVDLALSIIDTLKEVANDIELILLNDGVKILIK